MHTRTKTWCAWIMALLVSASAGWAADAGVEMGAEDDLTVLGTQGTLSDADLEVKGYSVFGTPSIPVPAEFTNGAGSVVIASNLFVAGKFKADAGIDLSGANMTVSNLTVQGILSAEGSLLQVLQHSVLQSNLTVGGNLTLSGNQSVAGNSTVSGTLGVNGDVTLGEDLSVAGTATIGSNVVINSTTPSVNKDTGALVVEGGVGIEQNLNVGGALGVSGSAAFSANVTVSGAATANVLSVINNATVGGNLSVTGNSALNGNATVGGTLGVTGAATVLDTTESTNKDTGSLVLEGGLGVEKSINAGLNLGVGGNAAVTGTVAVGVSSPDPNTKLQVNGGGAAGNFAAKFYAGTNLAAWVRKK